MSTGDTTDMLGRVKALMPRWFSDSAPVLDALLSGLAYAKSFIYQLLGYAKLQTRIKTATDGWLDIMAADFFGTALRRQAGQTDASFRSRIFSNMFRERATRNGLITLLTDLTGRAPQLYELQRALDTGCYGQGFGSNSGYGVAGRYGSMLLPFQAFVTVYRPAGTGIPLVTGYYSLGAGGYGAGGYGLTALGAPYGYAEYASLVMAQGLTDADIYGAIDSVKPAGTILWTSILN